ncbi:MAG: alpha/beta hydrolase [Polycyclovorans sp.]
MSVTVEEVELLSHGITLRAGVYVSANPALQGARGLPCIVMGHGLGGTRAAGLEPFARHFAAAGFCVVCFDYRGFGLSDGEPRQLVDIRMQLDDWHATLHYVRSRSDIDPTRIGLWGSSFSGGHVVTVAVEDGDVAAVSAQGAMLDGLATFRHLLRQNGWAAVLNLSRQASLDALRGTLGAKRITWPVVGAPGSQAILTTPDSLSGYLAIAPPDWVNAITLSWTLTLPFYRPNRMAARLNCPVLICITELDAVVPPAAMEDTACQAGDKAEVKRYPCRHFEIYVGDGFRQVVADQTGFFTRHLAS